MPKPLMSLRCCAGSDLQLHLLSCVHLAHPPRRIGWSARQPSNRAAPQRTVCGKACLRVHRVSVPPVRASADAKSCLAPPRECRGPAQIHCADGTVAPPPQNHRASYRCHTARRHVAWELVRMQGCAVAALATAERASGCTCLGATLSPVSGYRLVCSLLFERYGAEIRIETWLHDSVHVDEHFTFAHPIDISLFTCGATTCATSHYSAPTCRILVAALSPSQ